MPGHYSSCYIKPKLPLSTAVISTNLLLLISLLIHSWHQTQNPSMADVQLLSLTILINIFKSDFSNIYGSIPLLCLAFKVLIRPAPISSLLSLLFNTNYLARPISSHKEIGPLSPYLFLHEWRSRSSTRSSTPFFQTLKPTKMNFVFLNIFHN